MALTHCTITASASVAKTAGQLLGTTSMLLTITPNTGYVVSLGPDAYKDQYKFPDGAWGKKGDWVLFGRYAGSRFKIQGAEPRLLNDDEVLAVITDPRDIINV